MTLAQRPRESLIHNNERVVNVTLRHYLNGGDMTGHGETFSWRLPCRMSVSSVQPIVRSSKTNERDVNVKPSALNSP